MATTNPTGALPVAERRRRVRQLADEQVSNREIGRRLGIHHRTVARDLATPAPTEAPPAAPQDAPPAPTSGAPLAPRLLHDLEPSLIQDLNMLCSGTGALPEPIRRYLRAAADARRADWRARLEHRAAADAPPSPDAPRPAPAPVAP
ncbi:hypothetical protein ACOKM5_24305 [Streptomyces sp. BH097]|uniref:hypothetical protein n=1 Tax=Streptomyces sp. BH097 TaxID=3410406 RepID=UPI003CE852B1